MNLKEIRGLINRVDYDIVKLLNYRLELALRTKKLKKQVLDKEREQEVIENVQRIPLHLVSKDFTKQLFESIIAQSRGIQMEDRKMVGFRGEHGAHGELAITGYADNFVPIPCTKFIEVIEGIKTGYFDYGMLPVENSLEGGLSEVNDLLIQSGVKICGEIKQPFNYSLLTLPESDYRGIKVVYSHPQVLAHCSGFIKRNSLEGKPYYDAAAAARMIAETKPKAAAAIASPLCATLHNLDIIKENIEDDTTHFTRFLLLAKESENPAGKKCSIVFSTKNEFGELYSVLKHFNDAKTNLSRMESRPSPLEKGNFVFLVDFYGSLQDPKVKKILAAVEKQAAMYSLMGCYDEVEGK